MNDSQKFALNPDFKIEKFDNEILLYSISKSKGLYLNETAHMVWGLCGKDQSVGEIITLLEAAYPQQKMTVHEDVITAIESLVDNGVLIVTDE